VATEVVCPSCNKPLASTGQCGHCGWAVVQARPSASQPVAPSGPSSGVRAFKMWLIGGWPKETPIHQRDEGQLQPLSLEGTSLARIDRLLPTRPRAFLLAVTGLVAAVWLIGLCLADEREAYLASPEWRMQPFFLAVHLICLRLFVTCYARNFLAGAAYTTMPNELACRRMRQLLGPAGVTITLLIVLPFAIDDAFYLHREVYRESATYSPNGLGAVDWFLWLVWCAEWVVNAYIWVVMAGFFLLTVTLLWKYPFRAPVEVLLHEKHYRPFLQMSAQGASIILFFTAVYGFYVWYTAGDLADYTALAITALLLLLSFVPPWYQLRGVVQRMVDEETGRLHGRLVATLRKAEARPEGGAVTLEVLAAQVSETLAILHINYLERLHRELGRAEGKAVLLKLLAPGSAIAWQVLRRVLGPFLVGM
jgi:hypothetical protein